MSEMNHMQQIIEKLCINETIDGLHFWGPALQLSTDHSHYDDVMLRIEGTFKITKNGEMTLMKRDDQERLLHLCTLARQKILSLHLLPPNNLCIQFVSGMQLEILGENDQFEGWQLQGRVDDEMTLIVAGPGKRLTLFD